MNSYVKITLSFSRAENLPVLAALGLRSLLDLDEASPASACWASPSLGGSSVSIFQCLVSTINIILY